MQNFLSSITNLKPKLTWIIVFIAVLVVGYNLSIKPAQQQLSKLKKTTLKTAKTLQDTRNALLQKATTQQAIKKLELQYKKPLPQFSWNIFLADLENIAKITKIHLTIMPQNTVIKDATNLYPVNLETTGTYQQSTQFINLLAQTAYVIELPSFTLTPTLKPQLLMQASCIAYQPPITSVASNALDHTTFILPNNFSPRDPFIPNEKGLPLTAWANNSLKFIGVIKQDTKIWAILSDPDGFTHHATFGTPIGLNQSPIIKITADEITTKNPNDNLYRNAE